ncbi:MAG: hypothetical protein KDK66_01210 [Deltaproteobacteria bacterium]|nr:hypothetical protein [Deltaproteobacteria bacterium]
MRAEKDLAEAYDRLGEFLNDEGLKKEAIQAYQASQVYSLILLNIL